jgi:hypothetical protein
MRLPLSASTVSIISFSWRRRVFPSAAVRPATRLLGSRLNQVTNEKQLADLVEAAKLKLSAESSQKLNAVSAQKVAVETLGG